MDAIVKERIRDAFARRVATYDAYASVQQYMVTRLCRHIPVHSVYRILEIGCGTGQLTQALLTRFPQAQVVAVDLAPPMIQATQTKCADDRERLTLIAADAETYAFERFPPFDLVCTSATLQWFAHPQKMLHRCLEVLHPDGCLAFATFGEATLQQLRTAFVQAEHRLAIQSVPRTLSLPTMTQVLHWMIAPRVTWTLTRELVEQYVPDADTLLRQLKHIGANVVHRTQTPPFHKRLFHEMATCYKQQYLQPNGLPVTYDVLYGTMRRNAHSCDTNPLLKT